MIDNTDHISAVCDRLMKELEENRICPLVYIDGGFILFRDNEAYDIRLDRIDTPEKALGWIAHLMPKNWVTKRTIECLISVLEEAGVSVQR